MQNYTAKINNEIIKQMTQLYLMFCQPVYMVGETTSFKYRWNNARAAEMYKECEKLLAHNQSLELTRDADSLADNG